DPTCWDDVLIPGQISGVCQSENCNGTVAEFYFKCAKHIALPDEWAIPLYLIKNNFKHIPCIACTGISEVILVFPCADGHVICIECFRLYCISRLNERRFIQNEAVGYTIDCPAGCTDSLIKEPHHFRLLGDEQYSRYQRFGAEEYLLQAGGVLCPQPGCGAGLLPDPECRRVVCVQDGGGGCGFVFCRQCMQGFHIGPCEAQEPSGITDGMNYAIIDERASSSKWDEDSKKIIKITTKPCPKCRTPTERDGGCMHMVCTRSQCGYHWCWICQEEWTRDCMGNHWFG
ncbi:E3 ubiquitin-protein ligase parkin-like, partial [Stegodyphus dumicola]|uniref:E3 ubiquitin-protein ligase parkin-like n=1 Tax=Stegodyphus dumicola TaxID=202533 RepID=UPI0015A82A6B